MEIHKIRTEYTAANGKKAVRTHIANTGDFIEACTAANAMAVIYGGGRTLSVCAARVNEIRPRAQKDPNGNEYDWYEAKRSILTVNEKTGQEKRVTETVLIQAGEEADALENAQSDLTSSDWVTSIRLLPRTHYIESPTVFAIDLVNGAGSRETEQ